MLECLRQDRCSILNPLTTSQILLAYKANSIYRGYILACLIGGRKMRWAQTSSDLEASTLGFQESRAYLALNGQDPCMNFPVDVDVLGNI